MTSEEKNQVIDYLKYFSVITLKPIEVNGEIKKQPSFPWRNGEVDCAFNKLSPEQLSKHLNNPEVNDFAFATGFEDLEVIDVDLKVFSTKKEKDDFWEEYLGLLKESIYDFEEKFAVYKTKSNGFHILYKSKRVVGNKKIAVLKGHKEAIIESRGLKGFVYAYPKNHVLGKTYFDIQYITDADRELLWQISSAYNYIEPEKESVEAKTKKEFTSDGVTPWEDYNEKHNVWELIQDEFTIVSHRSRFTIVKRHGATSAHSGYIYKDNGCLFLHSTGTIYPHEKQLSPSTIYTYKYHNGDFSESAKDLYKKGYGSRIKAKINEIKPEVKEYKKIETTSFPLDVFPENLQYYITENVTKLSMDADYMGCSLLWLFSLMMGNCFEIKVKNGWIEKPVLWIALIGEAGVGKTPSINKVLAPIKLINNREIKKYYDEYERYDHYKSLDKKERMQMPEVNKPLKTQFIVNDITLEALTEMHQENKNAIGVHKDELAGWFKDMNKYREGSDLEFWLSSWSGESVNMNRKVSKSSYVNHPFIPVLGGIQPEIFSEMATHQNESNGFLDRVLLSFPENQVEYWNDEEMSQDDILWYNETIILFHEHLKSHVSLVDGEVKPITLDFTDEAKTEWARIFNKITDSQRSDAETEYIKSIYPKMKTYIPRLALIIETIDILFKSGTSPYEVSKTSLLKAERLAEYFVNSAKRIKIDNIESYDYGKLMKTANNDIDKIKVIYKNDPDFNRSKVAKELNVSRQTIYNYIKQIENEM